ncbi:hypothetical protein IH992_30695 [Candidatus Poribacteria bacterium]|nr:hypothetical protein [Candidatus Poribacteria bacterium]
MFTKFDRHMRITAIFSAFILALSAAWATNSYFKSKTMSIDNYLIEKGFQEDWIDTGDGSGYYKHHFTFDTSGDDFQELLEIQMRGKYITENNEVQMYDEYGDILESTSKGKRKVATNWD